MMRPLLLAACGAAGLAVGAGDEGFIAVNHQWRPVDFLDGPRGERPPPPRVPEEGRRTVHILISAYRDRLCGRTVFEAFRYARRADLVTVGLVEQFAEGDPRCVEAACALAGTPGAACSFRGQVRVREIPAREAHGPMHARSFSGGLLADEEFCLQIDSHTQFTQDWDAKLVADWEKARNEYAVLTTYLQRVEDMESREEGSNVNRWHEVPVMCATVSGQAGMVRNARAFAGKQLTRPIRTCYWGAGLSFSKCHAERNVPHDPETHGVFDGEEFTRAIRLWTSGYDMYHPSRAVLFHDYSKAQSDPKRWHGGSLPASNRTASYERLLGLLGMRGFRADLGRYGLGSVRTKAQYEELCGHNLAEGAVNTKTDQCGRFPWVPFDEKDIRFAPVAARAADGSPTSTASAATAATAAPSSPATLPAASADRTHLGPQPLLPHWHMQATGGSAFGLVIVAATCAIVVLRFSPLGTWAHHALAGPQRRD